jgi:hypothetical protein
VLRGPEDFQMMTLDWAERAVERLIEGVFLRSFRGRVHPRQIAKSLARRLEEGKVVSLRRVYAPNGFIVRLHPRDLATLAPFQSEMAAEMERYLADWVCRNRYHLCGPLRVEFQASDQVRAGSVRCETLLKPARDAAEIDDEPTLHGGALYPADDAFVPAARLVALDGPLRGHAFDLTSRINTMGRSRQNTLVLPDRHVSRFHARIDLEEHGFVLVDLGSRNGTSVGGQKITRHPLEPGNRLQLGSTLLEFQLLQR